MGYALPVTVAMVDMECGECGIPFSVPETFQRERKKSGASWYCPNGHGRVYKETELDRARKMLEDANRRNTELAQRVADSEKRAKAIETKERRLRNRVMNGICPCCRRHFSDLARHMKSKHPEAKGG